MARQHPADDEIGKSLALLSRIEAAAGAWDAIDLRSDNPAPGERIDLSMISAELRALMAPALDHASPLALAVRRLDTEVGSVVERANGTETPGFAERFLRRLHLSRVPKDIRDRDVVLMAVLVRSLERAGHLLTALDDHRQNMKNFLLRSEKTLVATLDAAKAEGNDGLPTPDTVEKLEARQDVVEAFIRHRSACNTIFHKLTVDAEYGILVLAALAQTAHAPGEDKTLDSRFSPDTAAAFSKILDLAGRDLLSIAEIERRKRGVDDIFLRDFPDPGAHVTSNGSVLPDQDVPQSQTASA